MVHDTEQWKFVSNSTLINSDFRLNSYIVGNLSQDVGLHAVSASLLPAVRQLEAMLRWKQGSGPAWLGGSPQHCGCVSWGNWIPAGQVHGCGQRQWRREIVKMGLCFHHCLLDQGDHRTLE